MLPSLTLEMEYVSLEIDSSLFLLANELNLARRLYVSVSEN